LKSETEKQLAETNRHLRNVTEELNEIAACACIMCKAIDSLALILKEHKSELPDAPDNSQT